MASVGHSLVGPGAMPIADVSYRHSEGGYPVCMIFLWWFYRSELIASLSVAWHGGEVSSGFRGLSTTMHAMQWWIG